MDIKGLLPLILRLGKALKPQLTDLADSLLHESQEVLNAVEEYLLSQMKSLSIKDLVHTLFEKLPFLGPIVDAIKTAPDPVVEQPAAEPPAEEKPTE